MPDEHHQPLDEATMTYLQENRGAIETVLAEMIAVPLNLSGTLSTATLTGQLAGRGWSPSGIRDAIGVLKTLVAELK